MKLNYFRIILLLFFGLLIQISATFSSYKIVLDDSKFLMEGLFQILVTDLDENVQSEVVVAGKNYTGQELFIYWLTIDNNFKPVVKWQSENLFEDRSVLWVTTGKFQNDKQQLLGVTNTKFYVYQVENDGLQLTEQFSHNLKPLNITAGDIDGDGKDEVIVARIGQVTSKIYNGYIEVWKLENGQWTEIAETGLLGNIRGISAGDINEDGQAEIFVEEGPQLDSGNIHVISYKENKFTEISLLKKPVKGAVYSLKVRKFPEGMRLLTGSSSGRINVFNWNGLNLIKESTELSFSSGLVDLETADLNNNQQLEIYVLGYPQRLIILNQ